MFVNKVLHFDQADREADVIVSDGTHTVICYAYPVSTIKVTQKITAIYGFQCTDIYKAFAHKYCIKKLTKYYAFALIAKVISKNQRIVQIGNLRIHLDAPIPNDIAEGEYVSFSVLRLDI